MARRFVVVGLALAALAPGAAAHAAPQAAGSLDRSYGTRGLAEHWVGTDDRLWRWPDALSPRAGGGVVLHADDTVGLDAHGALDPHFGTKGHVHGRIALLAPGVRLGAGNVPLDADGHPLPHPGRLNAALQRLRGRAQFVTTALYGLRDRTLLYLVQQPHSTRWHVTKLRLDGHALRRTTVRLPIRRAAPPEGMAAPSGSGVILAANGGVTRLRGDGSVDARWVGRTLNQHMAITSITPWRGAGAVVVGDTLGYHVVLWIDARGRIIHRLQLGHGATSADAVLTADARGRVLIERGVYGHVAVDVQRLLAGGRVDRSFGTRGTVRLTPGAGHAVEPGAVTVLADGRIVVAAALEAWEDDTYDGSPAPVTAKEWVQHGTALWRLRG